MPTKTNFRSFVNDIQKDFPTVDEFVSKKHDNIRKRELQTSMSPGPTKPKASRNQNHQSQDGPNPQHEIEKKKAAAKVA